MTDLTPNSSLDNVYQLERTDPVDAGVNGNGVSNRQAQQLLNRTQWIIDNVAKLTGGSDADYSDWPQLNGTDFDQLLPLLTGGSDANFSAMPQVGGDAIVSSGHVSGKGYYTKFADGTMWCWDYFDASSLTWGGSSPKYSNIQTITYPHAFSVEPSVVVGGTANRSSGITAMSNTSAGKSSTTYSLNAWSTPGSTPRVTYIAVGRWQ